MCDAVYRVTYLESVFVRDKSAIYFINTITYIQFLAQN